MLNIVLYFSLNPMLTEAKDQTCYPLQQQILLYLKAKHEALEREFSVPFPAHGRNGAT